MDPEAIDLDATPDLHRLPGHQIRRLQQIAASIFAIKFAEAGIDLTPMQYAALAVVRAHPGIDQVTLAGAIAADAATVGGVVDRLLQRGLLSRQISERDRRARCLLLTEEGRAVLEMAGPVVNDVQDAILSGLGPGERDMFLSLLRKAIEATNELSRAPLRPTSGRPRAALADPGT